MLEVRLIGRFEVKYDGKPVVISSRAAQSLFAYLILTAGISHRREKLAGMFWPEAREERARAYLRYELWRIRKAFSPQTKTEYLLADDINISFNLSAEYWLDVAVLTNVNEASSIEDLMNALSLFQGEFLPGFYDDWVTQEREHLQTVYEQKIARLLELLEGENRWSDILEWAERWISLGQSPEAAFRYLMIAYDTLGDRAKVASTYERYVQTLQALDLEPSEEIRAWAFRRPHKLNIPIPLTSFIGREKELKEIASLFSRSRLITLTGSGGVGKTRLAIQVVAEVLDIFPDGVWFLDLAPLKDPARVPNTLANLLKLRDSGELSITDLLINYLRFRTVLIIFDNCEHLFESGARLAYTLLTSCENLTILATSRESLRLSGEIPFRVPSLETPNLDTDCTLDELSQIESVRLFAERAAFISLDFGLNSQNVRAVAQICQRLDGIPLAIELAAARVNVLSVQQIWKRLDDRFNLLTHGLRSSMPRQQTLRAMIEWSYDLLSPKEQLLFRRLAVFVGGWTLEAAEEVCSASNLEVAEVLNLLSQLVDKSMLLVKTTGGVSRYRRLETIRQFAREKLLETQELAPLQDQHLIYFLKKVEEIEPYLMGTEQSEWMDCLDLEFDNIRLALEWAVLTKRGEEVLRLFGSLGWFWYIRCHIREGDKWFSRVLELKDNASKSAQAKSLGAAGWLHYAKNDLSAALSFHQESLELYRELDDEKGVSTQLQYLGPLQFALGNRIQARRLLEESLRVSRQVNNKSAMPRVLLHLGLIAKIEQDYATAWQYYEEGLAICREIQEGHLTTLLLGMMGSLALEQKNPWQGREYYKESLEICVKLKNKRAIANVLLDFVKILCIEGQYSEGAQLQGFAEKLFVEGEALTESHLLVTKEVAEILKSHLGEEPYGKEFDKGKLLNLEQAVEIALKQRDGSS